MDGTKDGTKPQSAQGSNQATSKEVRAFILPFILFMAFLGLTGLLAKVAQDLDAGPAARWLVEPQYWIYPLQTVLCGFLLLRYRAFYQFHWNKGWAWATAAGVLSLAIWLAPQVLFGAAPRTEGFDPTVFADSPLLYAFTLGMRLLRLVVVVPFVEEIFWRGFLMRILVREDFKAVPFGTFQPLSFFGVAICFMLVHAIPDWPAAFVTGLLFNGVACLTRSLGACVFAHALTNLLLGIYILATRQWGFW